MWLHILKKDLRLHWPLVAAVVAVKIAAVWMVLKLGIFGLPGDALSSQLLLLNPFSGLAFAGVAYFAIVTVVQSDPIVSNNDDWLVRPIRRSDLALAKIAFAALVTLVPTFVFDLGVGLMHGLDVRPTIGAAAYTALVIFIDVGLPALAIGTMTANRLQAAGILLVVFLIWIACATNIDYPTAPLDAWPVQLALQAIFIIAAALVLSLQYGRRNTAISRCIFTLATLCAIAVVVGTPTTIEYQIQQLIDGDTVTATGPIRLSFYDETNAKVIGKIFPPYGAAAIFVPLKMTLDPDRIVAINYVDVNIASGDGKPLYRGTMTLSSNGQPNPAGDFLANTFDSASNRQKWNYRAIKLPPDVFAELKKAPARLSLTYQLSAYAPAAPTQTNLPLGVQKKIAGFGVCETRLDPVKDQVVDLFCIPATDSSNCISAQVFDPAGVSIGKPQTRCSTTSTPWGLNTKALTDAGQFVMELPAASGAATRPLTLTAYRVTSHFTQTVVVPQVKLTDLTSATQGSGDALR